MHQVQFDPETLKAAAFQTVIITGGAGGIGAATARIFNKHGANVVIGDLSGLQESAEELIKSFAYPSQALFVPVNITDWAEMQTLFHRAIHTFGAVSIVIANAGVMESSNVLEMDNIDEQGNLRESTEASRVLDINMKGTLNTIRLAMFHMRSSSCVERTPRSIILVSSTSGYFGGTGNSAYIASKHGVIGLLRGSQSAARQYGISVKAIAPFFTPTRITQGLAERWKESGMDSNTPESVGNMIAQSSLDDSESGSCILVAGRLVRELELTRTSIMPDWLGQDLVEFMHQAFQFISSTGGYRLPSTGS